MFLSPLTILFLSFHAGMKVSKITKDSGGKHPNVVAYSISKGILENRQQILVMIVMAPNHRVVVVGGFLNRDKEVENTKGGLLGQRKEKGFPISRDIMLNQGAASYDIHRLILLSFQCGII